MDKEKVVGDMVFAAGDSLGTRTGVTISNSRSVCAHYVKSRAVQITWQPGVNDDEGDGDEGGGESQVLLPDFTDCIFEECSFLELPDDAEIHFYGENILFDCQFKPTQKIVTNGNMKFRGCSEVHIIQAEQKEYSFDFADTDNISFPNITTSNYSKYPTNIKVNGGSISLINGTYYAWNGAITGATVRFLGAFGTTGYDLMNCAVQAADALYVNKMIGNTLYFNGSAANNIELYGLLCIGNEIGNGTIEDGSNLTVKTGVSYGAQISIGNRPNMYGSNQSKISTAKVVYGNYNGMNVYAVAATADLPEVEAVYKPVEEAK